MSVRVTRKTRRVLERLATGPATPKQIKADTSIGFMELWPIIERLVSVRWITWAGDLCSITEMGKSGLTRAQADVIPPPIPLPPLRPARPPYPQRRTPFNRGTGRSR